MKTYRLSNNILGKCLIESLKLIRDDSGLKLMMGEAGREGDTAHFWVEDKKGNIYDNAKETINKRYKYKGREVNPISVIKEIKQKGDKKMGKASMFSPALWGKDVLIRDLRKNPELFKFIDQQYKNDAEIMEAGKQGWIEVLKRDSSKYEEVPEEFKNNPELLNLRNNIENGF